MRLGLLVLACSAGLACHWLLPIEAEVASRDGSAPDGAADAAADGRSWDGPRDIRALDSRLRDSRPRDRAKLDTGPPSYCNGITLYVRFDWDLLSAESESPTVTGGSPPLVPGKFLNAANFGNGIDVRYAAAGNYYLSQGSFSAWVKPDGWTFPCATVPAVFYGSVAQNGQSNAGPYMACDAAQQWLGVGNIGPAIGQNDAGGLLLQFRAAILAHSTAKQYWKNTDWNHLVSTWSNTSAPTLTFTLNGDPAGSGKTSSSTSTAWTPQNTPLNWLRLSNSAAGYSARAHFDDVAVWNRRLSPTEIKAIYSAGKALGDVCKL